MQHSLFLWWVTLVILAMAGAALGVCCALIARYYERLLGAGFIPDADSLAKAMRVALFAPLVPIIWVDDAGRTDVVQLITGLLAGILLAGLYARHGGGLNFVCISAAALVLLMLSCIDIRVRLLPDALTQPLLWLGLVTAWAGVGIDVGVAVAGVIAGYGLLAVPRWLWFRWRHQECVGGGDVKLLAALGAWVGAWGVVHVLMLACVAGSLFAMLHQRRWRASGAYAFGPFIALAGVADFLSPSGLQSMFYV